ncbi:thiamine-phosphate kinase [Pelobacter propionicus]|uniref:Thiamine-monophosphate kinase n=1 Tax=Pelobacter propionicus (strain DSM 2379 / NBRC 103807 / OttBd1) TaxID=338966 RepID=A1AS86_PELPD|nr:thiamine-phosphate kinase [Pelobacter propionicus]ABL00207.1 thiamine-phosphate kinase [Pelobacter propionicus DSM 2379]
MTTDTKLSTLGEFGLIDRIAAHVAGGEGVITGIGDDAAVTVLTPGMQLLTSTDMLLEDVHFRTTWHDPLALGRKSLGVSISDVAAMGAIPRWALLSLAIPAGFPLEFLDRFTEGFLAMAGEHGVTLIGGDTCSSKNGLVISVTIMAEQFPHLILRRSGARAGDEIWVSGTLGDAALVLSLLEDGAVCDEPSLLSRLLDPSPRTRVGHALAESGLVSAMIDVSDGLLADFGHIAQQSGVGGVLYLERLPISADFRRRASRFPSFPHHLILSGGEDYELAFTAAAENHEKIESIVKNSGIQATAVGIVTSFSGVEVVMEDGSRYIPRKPGFTHSI